MGLSRSRRRLGLQRLRVVDLVTGDQPIRNEDGSVAVVFNGEIYNFQELRERLRVRGYQFSTYGDTEIRVHLYEEEGIECVTCTGCSRLFFGDKASAPSAAGALSDRQEAVLLLPPCWATDVRLGASSALGGPQDSA